MTSTFTDARRDDTSLLTRERVKALFDYDADQGLLIWRDRPLSDFVDERACRSWNTRFAGKPAGAVNKRGYRELRIDYQPYLAHRLIWFFHHGEWPLVVDHVAGVRAGDRIENLRATDQAGNLRNSARRKDNRSAVTGVRRHGARWKAEIRVDRRTRYLGTFDSFDDAVAARRAAQQDHNFHENHGRSA